MQNSKTSNQIDGLETGFYGLKLETTELCAFIFSKLILIYLMLLLNIDYVRHLSSVSSTPMKLIFHLNFFVKRQS